MIPPHILDAIRARAGRPGHRSFYLYDTSVMRRKIAQLKAALPRGVAVYYAMKANPHPAFLAAARDGGAEGVEIASLGEGRKAVAAGFSPGQLIFTGPGKAPEELEWSVSTGIHAVHVESLVEAYRLNAICRALGKTQDILLRVNPNFHIHGAQANFSGDSCKLGLDENRLKECLPPLLALDRLRFQGLHVYAASGVLELDSLLRNCEIVFGMARAIEADYPGTRCAVIDFGGGFGIDYAEEGRDFSTEAYAAKLSALIAAFGFSDRRFVLELGRYLAADSGWYGTEILDIKASLGKKQIVCAGGSHHFRRPVALKINHPMAVVPMNVPPLFEGQECVRDEAAFIGGPLCNTADKLAAHDAHVTEAHVGDIAVFGLAGAYGLTMSHMDFLSHDRPEEVVIG